MITNVIKANGKKQKFDDTKFNNWIKWADDLNIGWSDIALNTVKRLHDECSTADIQTAMIKSCVEKETAAHLLMAGRLLSASIYKEAYGGFKHIPCLTEFYHKMTDLGLWANMDYTDDELSYICQYVEHDKDLTYNYTTVHQIHTKYLIKDRVNNVVFESPQMMFIGMALQNMEKQPKERRLEDVIKLYQYLSDLKINAPSPMLVNMRTNHRGYASCCVYKTDDNAKSLSAGDHIAYMMTCASAGIGGYIQTRSIGDSVRKGTIQHQGKLPYFRHQDTAVHANMQSSRGGACTSYINVLDPEIFDLLSLKNPMTIDAKKINGMDYALQVNRFFAHKVAKNEDWMLISYADAPDLYAAMFSPDTNLFAELYDKYLNSDVKKQLVSARQLIIKCLTEGAETGRIYVVWVDELNRHTPFTQPIYSSNLCLEIALPTEGYECVNKLYTTDSKGEIGLCSLGSIVLGRVTEDEYEDCAYYTVLMIDNVIELMTYPFVHLEYTAKARRSIGVGLTNLAHDMASNGLSYTSQDGRNYIHKVAERHSYYLHRASLRLGREKGVAEWIGKTKYVDGWTPLDTYNRSVDDLITIDNAYDWDELKSEIIAAGGIRNSVLEAMMPVESSSQLTCTTNSLYPIRNLKVVKTSGNNKNILIAPDAETLSDAYEIVWDMDSTDLINTYAIVQKWTGQAISADLYLKLDDKNRSIPTKKLVMDFLLMTQLGCKSRYYINTASGISRKDPEVLKDSGAECTSCKL